jgi:hypothetical protein
MEDLFNGKHTHVTRHKPANAADNLVCLNFKVPMRVRQQFKIYAARHNMTMTEVLLKLLDNLS